MIYKQNHLCCEGCGIFYPVDTRYFSAKQLRAEAKEDGWKYKKVLCGEFRDYCPECYKRMFDL